MTRYEPAIDLDAISALDVHVHVEADGHGHLSLDQELMDASAAYFKSAENRTPTVADLATRYRAAGMAAVVFTVDATTATGHPALSSEEIAESAAEHADVLIPFGSVDPHQGPGGGTTAPGTWSRSTACAGSSSTRACRRSRPTTRHSRPLWGALEELGVPALFHTGQNGIGAGLPGGRGIKLRYSNPLLLDDVAADFPGLTVILAHPSVPWQAEAISMATHKANVYIDLSGWRPKYFPPELVRAAGGQLRHKVHVRQRLPADPPRALAGRLRRARYRGGSSTGDREGHGRPGAGSGLTPRSAFRRFSMTKTVGNARSGTARSDGPAEPPSTLLYLMKQVELAVRAELDDLTRPVGLTALQYTALTVLERHSDLTAAHLARHSFVTGQTMADMVTSLLEPRPDRASSRSGRPPSPGHRADARRPPLLDRLRPQVAALQNRMLSLHSDAQATELRHSLELCRQALRDEKIAAGPRRLRGSARSASPTRHNHQETCTSGFRCGLLHSHE